MPRTAYILIAAFLHTVVAVGVVLLPGSGAGESSTLDMNLVIGVSVPASERTPYDAPDVEWVEEEPEYRTERIAPPEWKPAVHAVPDFSRPPDRLFDRVPGADREEIAPVEVFTPPPSYPRMARRRGYEGVSVIEFTIRTDGTCSAVRVAESSGHRVLDEAAIAAVLRWRFEPGQTAVQHVRFVFRLT